MTNERADAVLGIVVRASLEDYMFERLDNLHRRGIHDNEVIRFLRKEGLNDIAARYIEWSGAIDPDAEDDNTTTNPAVPDPGDAASYTALGEVRIPPGHTRFYPEAGGILDIPNHLVDTFRRGGAEELVTDPGDMPSYENLEQAIVQAVVEKAREYRIERGIFYAEPSVMSGWNVYKKRSGDDSGAFIGHYADENAAINILTSLGDGYPTND